jgi:hypothetical protein
MTEGMILLAAMLTVAVAILAALYCIARNAQPQTQRQLYRRHRPLNFK